MIVATNKQDRPHLVRHRLGDGKRPSLKILTLFRLLLWWGAEMARQVFIYKKPSAQIVHTSNVDFYLPVSSWVITRRETYCLVSDYGNQKVEIHPVAEMSQN